MIVANHAILPMRNYKMAVYIMIIAVNQVGNHCFICYNPLIYALQTNGLWITKLWFMHSVDMFSVKHEFCCFFVDLLCL